MAYPTKIKNFNAFVDGISYMGRVTEGSLPEIKIKTEEHRGAGMDSTVDIDMGQERMELSLTLADWPPEIFRMIGTRKRIVLRPVAKGQADGVVGYVATAVGLLLSQDAGNSLKPGNDAPMKLMMSPDIYKFEHEGETLIDIDVNAGRRIIGGVDQLAGMRAAMGF